MSVSVALNLTCPPGADRRDLLRRLFAQHFEQNNTFVVGFRSCYTRVEYESADEIPIETTMCPCGNPDHYLVLWTEGAQPAEFVP